MRRPALSLSLQLLLTFVGLLVGITVVLTTTAYRSLVHNLQSDATTRVTAATHAREQSVTQLFRLRHQHAEGFLASVQSLCAEPARGGRLAWAEDCVGPMLNEYRNGESASGVLLTYRNRLLRRSGLRITAEPSAQGSLASVIRSSDGATRYLVQASRGALKVMLQFNGDAVARLFDEPSGLGPDDEVALVDYDGRVLARSGAGPPTIAGGAAAAFLKQCRDGRDGFVGMDDQGSRAFQSFRPVAALGTACVTARIGYDRALAPAERLRRQLFTSGAWFALTGAVLSLVAAQWIAAPVRRLARSARTLQGGRFERPIPVSGPSEVRALARAFNAMSNDLAELVTREQAARRDAEAANRAKDDFLATVSHELRTPLTAILGWAHMLRGERLPPDGARHAIEIIERSARAQRQLIDDLLDVSRIVSDRLNITRQPVRVASVVDAALDIVRPQAATQQIEIETALDRSAFVLGDARRLEQVVWNLAWNAVKFTSGPGRVTITLERAGEEVILAVADTGIGISSTFLPYVFDWFRQADAKARSQSGLGLGLGIVRHLVRAHGGSVRAESRGEGQGATFTVALPSYEGAADPATHDRSDRPAAIMPASLRDVRVLLVEDDEDTREFVQLTLQKAGASVDAVASAADARRELLHENRDVLISDIRMPDENGYSLIQSLRSAGISIPAIALTALARKEDAEAARAAGFQLHIPKPIDVNGLVDSVAHLVQNRIVH